ncbi:hypothetical protein FOL47_007094, partial [Perkinsus chesapeaki]
MRIAPGLCLVRLASAVITIEELLDSKSFSARYDKAYSSPVESMVALNESAEGLQEVEHLEANVRQTADKVRAPPPPAVDWAAAGAVGPVRNQDTLFRKCDSCYAIAAIIVLESRFQIQTKIPNVIPFSVQQIVDCSQQWGNEGCNRGTDYYSYLYVKAKGMVNESSYPYKAKVSECRTSITDNPALQCLKEGDIRDIRALEKGNDYSLMSAVAEGPVAVPINGESRAFNKYKSGIIT